MSETTQKTGEHDGLSEDVIRGLLAAGEGARRSVPLDELSIRVDGESAPHPQPTRDGGVSVITDGLSDFVEISAVWGNKRVPLVSFSLTDELRSQSFWSRITGRQTFTAALEGGRSISVTIRSTHSPSGSPAYELVAQAGHGQAHAVGRATAPARRAPLVMALTAAVFVLILFAVWNSPPRISSPPPSNTDLVVDKGPTPSATTAATSTPLVVPSPAPVSTPAVTRQGEAGAQQTPTPPHQPEVINDAQLAAATGITDPALSRGLNALPADISTQVISALKNPASLSTAPGHSPPAGRYTTMGNGEGESFRLKSPLGVVVRETTPTLSWEGLPGPGPHEYTVVIRELGTDSVVASTETPVSNTSWRPKQPLARGKSYGWFVSTSGGGKTVYAPAAGMGTFKVLDEESDQLLARAEAAAPDSLLVRAVLLYRVGLVRESAEAFARLEALNPRSRTVKVLRRRVEQAEGNK